MPVDILKPVSLDDFRMSYFSHLEADLRIFQGHYVRTSYGKVAGHEGDIFEALSMNYSDDQISIFKRTVVFWPWHPSPGMQDIPTHDYYEMMTFYFPNQESSNSGSIKGRLMEGTPPKNVNCLLRPENITETESGIQVIGSAMPYDDPSTLDYFSPHKTIMREEREGTVIRYDSSDNLGQWDRLLREFIVQAEVFEPKGKPVPVGIEFLVS